MLSRRRRRRLERTSRLLLNRGFWEDELQDWDEASIRLRSRGLFDFARRRWPDPSRQKLLESLALDLPPDKSRRVSDDEDVIDEPPIEPSVAESLLEEFARRGTPHCRPLRIDGERDDGQRCPSRCGALYQVDGRGGP